MNYVAGIDEAGRGPVIGPMVMTIAAVAEEKEAELRERGVDDSKALSPNKRRELAAFVEESCELYSITLSNKDIDAALLSPTSNLNILEAETSGKLINSLVDKLGLENIKHVILDCPTANISSYLQLMKKYVSSNVKLIAEHKADAKYPVVSAASIIAKTKRDADIEDIKKEHAVEFGSGYPGDGLTARFVREHFDEYDFFRTTWATYKEAQRKASQRSLGDFSVGDDISPKVKKQLKNLQDLQKKYGLAAVETKNSSEVYRLKGEGVTITLYSTGKLLVQGKEKSLWSSRV